MILQGNQRGGAKNLALHLLKDENEHVDIHELRGFVSEDLVPAFNEIYAVSRGTKAKQPLFSLSLNPPLTENVSTDTFIDTIERVEAKLGLTGQPRAIVFHEKEGPNGFRRHCHAVWSRIDAKNMKAIPLPYTKRKLVALSKELYLENGWQMPRGFISSEERDPKNFTLAQWQQAKRIGKDPRAIKQAFQECWAVSDSQQAFQQALKERGLTLARGDRRGFVALDHTCEVFAVSKWVSMRVKEIRTKLTDQTSLPSVDEAKEQIARDMAAQLGILKDQQNKAIKTRIAEIEQTRLQMANKHNADRKALKDIQQQRWQEETQARQERFNKGLRGLLDYVTGNRRRIKEQNEIEALQASKRDQQERDTLIFAQADQRRVLQSRTKRLKTYSKNHVRVISRDMEQYRDVQTKKRQVVDFKQRTQQKLHKGPERER